jgi:hypothetical protein
MHSEVYMISLIVLLDFENKVHPFIITGFVTMITRWVPLVEQELPSFPEHLS